MSEGIFVGPLFLPWGGLMIALGVSAGALLAGYEARRRGEDPEIIYYLFVPVTLWGLAGARMWHIFTPPLSSVQLGLTTGHYLTHPLDALSLWIGGYGVPGALLGGTFGLFLFSRKYQLPFRQLTDLLAPAIPLAMSIGRIGDYFSHELYGLPARLPWRIYLPPDSRLAGYETVEFYHPLFAYESLANLGLLILLLWLSREFTRRLKPGDLFLIFLSVYSAVRFLLEFLRLDAALIHGININQVFFALLFTVTGGFFAWNRRRSQKL